MCLWSSSKIIFFSSYFFHVFCFVTSSGNILAEEFFFVSCVEAHKYFTARGQQDIVMAKKYNLIRIEKNEETEERMRFFGEFFDRKKLKRIFSLKLVLTAFKTLKISFKFWIWSLTVFENLNYFPLLWHFWQSLSLTSPL